MMLDFRTFGAFRLRLVPYRCRGIKSLANSPLVETRNHINRTFTRRMQSRCRAIVLAGGNSCMTPQQVDELQQRIDHALWCYRGHPDEEDIKQEAWLRLLQVERKYCGTGQYQDLRRIARQTALWAAQDFFNERRSLLATTQYLERAGYERLPWDEVWEFLLPREPDFAPALIRRLAARELLNRGALTPIDRWIVWQVAACQRPLRAVAADLRRHYSYVRYRYERAIAQCQRRALARGDY